MPTPQQVERRARGIQLRTLGLGYEAIAQELGCSVSTAYDDVAAGLRFYLAQFGAEEEATASLLRMDAAARVAMSIMLKDSNDAPVRLSAIDRLIRIEARRADLLGLDAPKAINIRGEFKVITVDDLSQVLAELEAELGQGVGDAGRVVETRAIEMGSPAEAGSGG